MNAGLLADYFLYRTLKPKRYPLTALLTVINCVILLKAFDDPMMIIKGLIFSQSLVIVGYCDAMTHTIPDLLLLPVAAAGLVNFQLIFSLEGLISMSVLFFIVAWLTHEKGLGGGDVKLAAATGFAIGPAANVIGALLGAILFLFAYYAIFRKKKMYAMAPWLGAGCFFAYIFVN